MRVPRHASRSRNRTSAPAEMATTAPHAPQTGMSSSARPTSVTRAAVLATIEAAAGEAAHGEHRQRSTRGQHRARGAQGEQQRRGGGEVRAVEDRDQERERGQAARAREGDADELARRTRWNAAVEDPRSTSCSPETAGISGSDHGLGWRKDVVREPEGQGEDAYRLRGREPGEEEDLGTRQRQRADDAGQPGRQGEAPEAGGEAARQRGPQDGRAVDRARSPRHTRSIISPSTGQAREQHGVRGARRARRRR